MKRCSEFKWFPQELAVAIVCLESASCDSISKVSDSYSVEELCVEYPSSRSLAQMLPIWFDERYGWEEGEGASLYF